MTAAPGPAGRVGLVLALSLSVPVAAAAVGIAVGLPVTALPLALSTIALGVWGWRARPLHAAREWWAVALVLAVAVGWATAWLDLSFDGQTYHQTGIRLLIDGWNPVWDPARSETVPVHYHVTGLPKGMWLYSALWAKVTGSIETGKAAQLISLVAALLLSHDALRALHRTRTESRIGALLLALNPVTLQQLPTYYLDGVVASGTVTLLAMGILAVRTPIRAWRVALVLQAAWLANVKFPGAAIVAEIALAAIAWSCWRARTAVRPVVLGVTCAGALALLMGINPYVTNTMRHGHPGYPAAGPDAEPVAEWAHRDAAFRAMPRPLQVAWSAFAISSDDSYAPPKLKIPFTVWLSELGTFTTDARIGGWGPLFGGALVVAALMLALARNAPLAALALLPVASALALPFGFYARYAPQLWLTAVVPLAARTSPRSLRLALTAVLGLNLVLVDVPALGAAAMDQWLHRRQLRDLAADADGQPALVSQTGAPFGHVDLHLAAYGIRAVTEHEPSCPLPSVLLRTHARLCLAGGRNPRPAPDPLTIIRQWLPAGVMLPSPAPEHAPEPASDR